MMTIQEYNASVAGMLGCNTCNTYVAPGKQLCVDCERAVIEANDRRVRSESNE